MIVRVRDPDNRVSAVNPNLATSVTMGVDFGCGDETTYVLVKRLSDGTARILETGKLQCRVVRSARRKRKLNRRGDICSWRPELNAWTWNRRIPST